MQYHNGGKHAAGHEDHAGHAGHEARAGAEMAGISHERCRGDPLMFGKLTLEAVPFHEPIIMITLAVVALAGLGIFGAITYCRKWGYLWTEWLTSVDHKKIGVMYILVA
ncbi:hypothetical protein UMZ34_20870 [Halopseudomonas pachastrellae]|nr:hypothetical protein UMZ34_20870 [Halopseudomonas pachastrellae]